MIKNFFSIFLLTAIGSSSFAQTKVSDTPLNYEDETEASAALLFLDLYNQGLAGGKSGVCVDLNYDIDGRPQFKAAFDTSAFETGKSNLKSGDLSGQGFNSDNFKKLIDAIAKIQNGKVNASIDGFADGQHYDANPFVLQDSIVKNEKLSLDRAKIIGDLIDDNPNINVTKVSGHASPFWEKKYPGRGQGLNCPTRRKVVVTFDQPNPQVESNMSGSFFRTPPSMDVTVKNSIKKEFDKNVKDAQSKLKIKKHNRWALDKRPNRADVDKIYAQLMKDKKINAKCDLAPFKQMTLAMIEFNITDFGSNNVSGKKESIIEAYMAETKFKMKDISGGKSALQEGCLVTSPALTTVIQDNKRSDYDTDDKDKLKYAVSGSSFLSSSHMKSSNGKVNIGFDINSLELHKVKTGPYKGQEKRGFFCNRCGNGAYFHENATDKTKFDPEYMDRIVKFDDKKDQDQFIQNLNAITAEDPFSVAAMIKPRMFVVKDCKDCSCDHTARIKDKYKNTNAQKADDSVLVFDPFAGNAENTEMDSNDFENACIIRPSVHHACNVEPVKNEGSDKSTFKQELTYKSSLQNLSFTGSNINELISNVSNSCSEDKKKITVDQKISDVMCSSDKMKKLPSVDPDGEEDDCLEFDAIKAK